MCDKCETKFCEWRKREEARLVFKNTCGREPTEEELKTFMDYLDFRRTVNRLSCEKLHRE